MLIEDIVSGDFMNLMDFHLFIILLQITGI
jgi:hypothetical protein